MKRKTGQRQAIRDVLTEAGRPLNAQEVLELAQSDVPKLGIATVYRNLKRLVEDGWLRPVELPSEPIRYEPSALKHHHHFQCEACSRVFDLPGCPGPLRELAPEGFHVSRHEVTLYGSCPDCYTAPAA